PTLFRSRSQNALDPKATRLWALARRAVTATGLSRKGPAVKDRIRIGPFPRASAGMVAGLIARSPKARVVRAAETARSRKALAVRVETVIDPLPKARGAKARIGSAPLRGDRAAKPAMTGPPVRALPAETASPPARPGRPVHVARVRPKTNS